MVSVMIATCTVIPSLHGNEKLTCYEACVESILSATIAQCPIPTLLNINGWVSLMFAFFEGLVVYTGHDSKLMQVIFFVHWVILDLNNCVNCSVWMLIILLLFMSRVLGNLVRCHGFFYRYLSFPPLSTSAPGWLLLFSRLIDGPYETLDHALMQDVSWSPSLTIISYNTKFLQYQL